MIVVNNQGDGSHVLPSLGHAHRAGRLTRDGNLAGFIDRALLAIKHVYGNGPYDPEGLLSTLPAIVTALIGFWAGDWVRHQRVGTHVTKRLAVAGLALAGAGAAWAPLFPINKKLWTSSYVLFSGGSALFLLALTYEVIASPGLRNLDL